MSTLMPSAHVEQFPTLTQAMLRLREVLTVRLVILDLNLPDAKGATVVQSVRYAAPGARIIVFTAIESAMVRRHAIELGADRVVGKSESPDALADAVRELLNLPRHGERDTETVTAAMMVFNELTQRQRAILKEVASGASNAEIARRFDLAENTIKSHVHSILSRIGMKNRTEAARWYYSHIERNV